MEKDLIKFMDKVKILSKELSEFKDTEKGIYSVLGTAQLFCNVDYLELDEAQFKQALFNQILEKDTEYSKITVKRTVTKDTITKNKKDETTLIDKDVEVSQVWIVKNQLGLTKAYNNKEYAMKYAEDINNQIKKLIIEA